MGSLDMVDWWNVNVDAKDKTPDCPVYLAGISAKDRSIISTPDAEYVRQSWDEVREIVRSNRLELFQRVPSELRAYRRFTHWLAQEWGSIARYLAVCRLHWPYPPPLPPVSGPRRGGSKGAAGMFGREDEYKILYNDWPYGLDERVVHLVVWTKFPLEEDPETQDLTAEAREAIARFVTETFSPAVKQSSHLLWFKNWSALKSVHAIEHLHVMLYDPDPDAIRRLTGDDVPTFRRPEEQRLLLPPERQPSSKKMLRNAETASG
ncbi:hypothetical protein N3K66_001358 [Trichothecium roseum]|uniref:Uncharacterized protein n=1 Tax=Trichothecium roseum TaxID=47278 RepID=A0ACC0VF49_9HYPO|nr:hypothetical protein N3K66_001358 [Trichothecium roseum]